MSRTIHSRCFQFAHATPGLKFAAYRPRRGHSPIKLADNPSATTSIFAMRTALHLVAG